MCAGEGGWPDGRRPLAGVREGGTTADNDEIHQRSSRRPSTRGEADARSREWKSRPARALRVFLLPPSLYFKY